MTDNSILDRQRLLLREIVKPTRTAFSGRGRALSLTQSYYSLKADAVLHMGEKIEAEITAYGCTKPR